MAPVLDAVDDVRGYEYPASGFSYEEVPLFGTDARPVTARVETRFEGAYAAPDRSMTRYRQGAPGGLADESRAIGRDLWIRAESGWERLPGAAEPGQANVVERLLVDAPLRWSAVPAADRNAASLPGTGCVFRSRSPLARGTRGYRETLVRVDPATALPVSLRVEVRDAFDPFGNRHDSRLLYRVRYDPSVRIDPPAQP